MPRSKLPPLPNYTCRNLRQQAENYRNIAQSVSGKGTQAILEAKANALLRQAEEAEKEPRHPDVLHNGVLK